MKFSPDDAWSNRNGDKFIVISVTQGNFPIRAKHLIENYIIEFAKTGEEIPGLVSEFDLVKFHGCISKFPEYLL